jgi:hypothetical protein
MPTWLETKLTNIKTLLETVPEIKNVFKRERWTTDPAQFRTLFTETKAPNKRVHTWMITREAISGRKSVSQFKWVESSRFVVKGFISFDDAEDSWTFFQNLIDKIRDAFRNNAVIWDVCEEDAEQTVQVREIGYRMLGEVLCHYCELVMDIEQQPISG